jgi:hypothetical protein
MKQIIFGLCLLVITLDGSAEPATEANKAKAAIKDLAGALQAELKGAMQAGGPVAAIAVCNTQAITITAKVAAGHDIALSRVSLKNRNPANAPNAWQTAVLEDFERQKSAGENVTTLTWSETAKVKGGREFRFMKAIPTGAVCLNCHGTSLAPGVTDVLASLYPEDRATGFSEGDIRGAFVVTRKLPD